MQPPEVDAGRWRLHIAGLVGEARTLSMDELLALPSHDFCAVMVCIDNPVGGHRVGNATWRGVPCSTSLRTPPRRPTRRR